MFFRLNRRGQFISDETIKWILVAVIVFVAIVAIRNIIRTAVG